MRLDCGHRHVRNVVKAKITMYLIDTLVRR